MIQRQLTGSPAGEVLTLVVGDRSGGGPGARMPTMRALNKFVVLYEAQDENDRPNQWNPANGGRIVAACSMHVLGGPIHHVRAYVPSHARPGQEIVVLVRPEDEHSNLSPERLDGGRVSLNGRALDARAEAVPESSCLRLHVVLPHEGVHRLRVAAGPGGWTAEANPIVCADSRPALRPHHVQNRLGQFVLLRTLPQADHRILRVGGLDLYAVHAGQHQVQLLHGPGAASVHRQCVQSRQRQRFPPQRLHKLPINGWVHGKASSLLMAASGSVQGPQSRCVSRSSW